MNQLVSMRPTGPTTTERLAEAAYHAWTKEHQRLGGPVAAEWSRLGRAENKAWLQATSTVASHVAFTGCPRPLDLAGDVCEASRCAEWLLHIADGGDAGSEAQLRMLLRTAAGLLVRPIHPGSTKPQPSPEFADLRRALAELPRIEEWHVVAPPGGQDDLVIAGSPDLHIGTIVVDTADFEGDGKHSLEYAAYVAAANPKVVQQLLQTADGGAS